MELPAPPPERPAERRTRPWFVTFLIVGLIAASATAIVLTRETDGPPIDIASLPGTILFATSRNEVHPVTCHYPESCNVDVYLMDADGSGLRPLIDGPRPEYAGALSRDGAEAVVPKLSGNGESSRLLEIDVESGRTHVLLSSPRSITWPQFSPDGHTIVFGEQLRGDGAALFLIDVRTRKVRQLTQTDAEGDVFVDGYATWSPDGRSIAFTRISDADRDHGEVIMLDIGSGTYRQMYDLEDVSSLAWSPDGSQIACTAKAGDSHEVFLLPASGEGEPTALTHDSGYDSLPAWSPDGAYIVFTSNRTGVYDLYVMRADGSGVTPLPTQGTPNGGSSWAA